MKPGENSLFPLVHDYLKIYLPKQRDVSPNTIRSYRKALEELLDYVKDCEQISLGEVTFDHLTTDMILSFLEYLEIEKDCSVPTRNTRFAAVRAFMDYAADRDFTLVANLNIQHSLRRVKLFRSCRTGFVNHDPDVADFFGVNNVKIVLAINIILKGFENSIQFFLLLNCVDHKSLSFLLALRTEQV